MLGLSISRTAASAKPHLQRKRERERETERLILKLSSHYSVVIFRFICRICSKIVGGVVRRACAFGSSTILCRVHQLELSLQSCAHFCLSFWIQARNCKKNWPSLQDTWIWISAGFRTFALCLLSPDHYTREDSARMPTQNVSRACSLWPWPTLWVSVCLIGKWANLLPRHNNVLKLKCSIM